MVSGFEIVDKIWAYLSGQMNLVFFREWIVRAHLEVEGQKGGTEIDRDAARLLAEIEGRYAEFSDGIVSEDLWRRRLASLIVPVPHTVQSHLLTFFYSPSFQSLPTNEVWGENQASNSLPANYQPEPKIERSAA